MDNETRLEEKVSEATISGLLDEALLRVASPNAKYAVPIYIDLHGVSFEIFADGILKFWKSYDKDGNPFTDFIDVSKEDFMLWLRTQSQDKKNAIYSSLRNYEKN